jgi:prepilin-type N-terminal cleavage/methylation domain-containing protein
MVRAVEGVGSTGARGAGGFTLIEVLVALAIMAVGSTAAIGLFTAATALHKRAVDQTSAALVASSAIDEVRGAMTLGYSTAGLERMPAAAAAASGGAPVLIHRKNAVDPAYPGYAYDVLLTPLDAADPEEADSFHVEVRVRWRTAGPGRVTEMHSVVTRRAAMRDLVK